MRQKSPRLHNFDRGVTAPLGNVYCDNCMNTHENDFAVSDVQGTGFAGSSVNLPQRTLNAARFNDECRDIDCRRRVWLAHDRMVMMSESRSPPTRPSATLIA